MAKNTKGGFDPTALNADGHILWFDDLGTGNDEYRFLSNFYEGEPITLPGVTWESLFIACEVPAPGILPMGKSPSGPVEFKTGEHAFAAMKFWGTDWTHFLDIVKADGPNPAKALGRSRKNPLREDWEVVKLDVMAAVTRAKYAVGRKEASLLLATDNRLLVEGTFWKDDVWGVCVDEKGLPGRNWLGSLLMMRRAELRAFAAYEDDRYVSHFVSATGIHNAEFSA